MRLFKAMSVVLAFLGLAACNRHADKTEGTIAGNPAKVSLRQEWFPNSNYAGALFASRDFAKTYNLELKVDPGSDSIDPIKMVLSGANNFGDAGADKILAANEKGADLVVIGVVNLSSPVCFLAERSKHIRTPKDFEGHTVGILTGTSTEYIYRTLIKKAGVNTKKLKEVEAPFDLATFITGVYDVRPAFVYDEPVSLDLKGVRYTMIEPKNYGVSFLGTVYFTSRKMIEEHGDVVQKFVNSVADGWKAACKYPERSIEYLKEYDKNIDSARELASLKKGLPYFEGKDGKILYADLEDWSAMLTSLQELGVVKHVDLEKSIDNSFLESYYKNDGDKAGRP
jgi:NitT/TauT family transport system substrate-binding protein